MEVITCQDSAFVALPFTYSHPLSGISVFTEATILDLDLISRKEAWHWEAWSKHGGLCFLSGFMQLRRTPIRSLAEMLGSAMGRGFEALALMIYFFSQFLQPPGNPNLTSVSTAGLTRSRSCVSRVLSMYRYVLMWTKESNMTKRKNSRAWCPHGPHCTTHAWCTAMWYRRMHCAGHRHWLRNKIDKMISFEKNCIVYMYSKVKFWLEIRDALPIFFQNRHRSSQWRLVCVRSHTSKHVFPEQL